MERQATLSAFGRLGQHARPSTLRWPMTFAFIGTIVVVIWALLVANRVGLGQAPGASGVLHNRITLSTLATAGLRSPSSAAFAPDSHHIAVIGVLSNCGQRLSAPSCGHALAIYALSADGRSMSLERIIPLEALLGLGDSGSISSGLQATFTGMGWSPDGARVAVVFTLFQGASRSLASEVFSGLLVIAVAQQQATIIVGDSGYFTSMTNGGALLPVWRLGAQNAAPAYTLEPGLTYAWNSQGFPYPITPLTGEVSLLPISAASNYPVGNPDGGAPFTIWQPGMVIGPDSAGLPPDQSAFVSTFPSWTADGEETALLRTGVALQAPSGAIGAGDSTPTSDTHSIPAPAISLPTALFPVPPRDAALATLQQAVGRAGWALAAWNPDGSLLASVNCFAKEGQTLTISATNNGGSVGVWPLALGSHDPGCQGFGEDSDQPTGVYTVSNLGLTWSPDGSLVLISDSVAATLTLWQVSG